MVETVLVVCAGNICRSPMAEALLAAVAAEGRRPLKVSSAGITAVVGAPAHRHTQRVLEERSVDASMHRARQLEEPILRVHDLIVAMDRAQVEWIHARWPHSRGRVFRWGQWLDEGRGRDVPDPVGQPLEAFRETFALIDEGLDRWARKLSL